MPVILICDICNKKVDSPRQLKVINKVKYCGDCYKNRRHERRQENIKKDNLAPELRELSNKYSRERRKKAKSLQATTKLINPNEDKQEKPFHESQISISSPAFIPKIKNQNQEKLKKSKLVNLNNTYLTFQESQIVFKNLISQGLTYEEAKERIQELKESQKELWIKMKKQNKSEEEIKLKQNKMIEDLCRY